MHLDLASHEECLAHTAVGIRKTGVVQPNPKLQRVLQAGILQFNQSMTFGDMPTFTEDSEKCVTVE